jgi:hypothetical protein
MIDNWAVDRRTLVAQDRAATIAASLRARDGARIAPLPTLRGPTALLCVGISINAIDGNDGHVKNALLRSDHFIKPNATREESEAAKEAPHAGRPEKGAT